jgi:hypothetical protein
MVNNEHFEEEELPEHSDYSDSSENEENGAEYEYGELELDDSDGSSSGQSAPKQNNDEVCKHDPAFEEEIARKRSQTISAAAARGR